MFIVFYFFKRLKLLWKDGIINKQIVPFDDELYSKMNNVLVNSYVAPELISRDDGKLHKHRSKGSEKSDLWQLGILFFKISQQKYSERNNRNSMEERQERAYFYSE